MTFRPIAVVLMVWSCAASADDAADAGARAARLIAAMKAGNISVMGLQKSIEVMKRQGMTDAQAECVRATPVSVFEPVLARVAAEELTAAEIDEAIRFYESPSGKKYVVMTEVKSAEMLGVRTSSTMPEFTAREIASTEAFGKTAVFQKLVNENVLTRSVSGRNQVQNLTLRILKGCGVGR